MLESRESDSAFASNSRADPVQGMSYRELFVTKILSLFIQPSNAASKTDSLLMARAPSVLLLLALATAATLAGVSCGGGGSTWPASMHSKPVAGPGVSTTTTVTVVDDDNDNDNVVDHSRKEYPIQSQSQGQGQGQVKQAKRVVVVELLAVAKQKLKRFLRQLRCSALSDATAATQQQQQQQMLLAAR